MFIVSCHLENFASYKELNFNFSNQGLTLIHGATGSGKSTLCDAIPWVLFGKTAKDGSVDDILSWNGIGQTYGHVVIDMGTYTMQIVRARKPNDLYYVIDETTKRGKDLNDTQKQINELLGIDPGLYLAGAYFHEFSQTAQFFTATAKIRRTITEQLVDLALPKKLQEQITIKNKLVKDKLLATDTELQSAKHQENMLVRIAKEEEIKSKSWTATVEAKIKELTDKSNKFQLDKDENVAEFRTSLLEIKTETREYYDKAIDMLTKGVPAESVPCKECGTPKRNPKREAAINELRQLESLRIENDYKLREVASIRSQLKTLQASVSPYLERIEEAKAASNPYTKKRDKDIKEVREIRVYLLTAHTKLVGEKAELEILSDAVNEFRGLLIKNTILSLEEKTNQLLSKHFDAEISMRLSIEDSDKLDIVILKDGNMCNYTQLSKGQRQLLKLCFGVSVMKTIAMHHSVDFKQVFFDEALDGLDDNFKVKAYGLLQSLAADYDSVFVVEHSSELKERFINKFKVMLNDGNSEISEEV